MKILVTGANRGLGLALAQVGAERGHHILAGVRDIQQGEKIFTHLNQSKSITIFPLDVTSERSVERTANIVKEQFGTVDVIINNAGVLLERGKAITELDMEEVKKTFEVNVFGPMRLVKHFLPLLFLGGDSSIINISSEAGSIENAYGGDYAYGVSKTALNMFSEQLRDLVKVKNIQVYAIHPGWIKTDMGGVNAPGDPAETAEGIFDIIEGKRKFTSRYAFINYLGESMPL